MCVCVCVREIYEDTSKGGLNTSTQLPLQYATAARGADCRNKQPLIPELTQNVTKNISYRRYVKMADQSRTML